MKKTIWKFKLSPYEHIILMPKGAEILCVQTQDKEPQIWALVDPNAEKEKRYFEVIGTRHKVHCDIGIERKYIGTFQLDGGALVFHVFERIN